MLHDTYIVIPAKAGISGQLLMRLWPETPVDLRGDEKDGSVVSRSKLIPGIQGRFAYAVMAVRNNSTGLKLLPPEGYCISFRNLSAGYITPPFTP